MTTETIAAQSMVGLACMHEVQAGLLKLQQGTCIELSLKFSWERNVKGVPMELPSNFSTAPKITAWTSSQTLKASLLFVLSNCVGGYVATLVVGIGE